MTYTHKTISEAQADPATAVVFEDIKSTMGVALVNLVWRRLAVNPSVLQWCWKTLKPHYLSGAIPAAAWQLREQVQLPAVQAISADERLHLKHELNDLSIIDDTLRTYERGNAQNLVALCHLKQRVDSINPSHSQSGSNSEVSNVFQLDEKGKESQLADARFGTVPELPPLENLPDELQLMIIKASEIWVPGKYHGLMPSVFRHLSYWPELLSLLVNRLEAIERSSNPAIESMATKALQTAENHAGILGECSNILTELNVADRQWLQAVLDVFIDGMLARGVIIVPVLRFLISREQLVDL